MHPIDANYPITQLPDYPIQLRLASRHPASLTSPKNWTLANASSLEDGVRLFDVAGSADRRLAGQSRARAPARRTHLLQLQHPSRSDERLRRELSVLLVRAAEARRSGRVHDVARGGVGQAAEAQRSAADRSARGQRPASRSAVQLLHGSAARASNASGPTFT